MLAIFYKNYNDKIHAKPNLEEIGRCDINFLEDVNIMSPTFTTQNLNFIYNANYVYIQEFNKYYYIDEPSTKLSGNRLSIKAIEDTIYSFYNEIMNTSQNITRQENEYNLYLNDNKMQVLSNKKRIIKNFNAPVDGFPINPSRQTNNTNNFLFIHL